MAVRKGEVDLAAVESMAAKFCQKEEIARVIGFGKDDFDKRKDVCEAFEKGRNAAKIAVRTLLYGEAVAGDKQAIFFLAKNELGYRDYPQQDTQAESAPSVIDDVGAVSDGG